MAQYKISVLGDVMTEPPFMKGIRRKNGTYDYASALMPLKGLLSEADLCLANLETPVAGEDLLYSQTIVSFNAPESIVTALKKIGVDAVSTANNHALDRGAEGLTRTIETLDRLRMPHTGTYLDPSKDERILYLKVKGLRVAVIAYTYGTNTSAATAGVDPAQINYLMDSADRRPVPWPKVYTETEAFIQRATGVKIAFEDKAELKRILGISAAYGDDYFVPGTLDKFLPRVKKDVDEARKNADLVLFLPHTGGQFNVKPGAISKHILAKCAKMGFDAIFAAHSHTSQMAKTLSGCPVFYSLGNVSMSSNTKYSQHETLPMYGLVGHIYIEEKKVARTTYSIFRIVEEEGKPMRVVPVDELWPTLDAKGKKALEKDVAAVAKRVSGFAAKGKEAVRREYGIN